MSPDSLFLRFLMAYDGMNKNSNNNNFKLRLRYPVWPTAVSKNLLKGYSNAVGNLPMQVAISGLKILFGNCFVCSILFFIYFVSS